MEKEELEKLIQEKKVEMEEITSAVETKEDLTAPTLDDYVVPLEKLRRGDFMSDVVLIKSGTFTNSFDITGLNGNIDGFYSLIIQARHSSAFFLNMRFNGDSGANYHLAKHINSRQGGTNFHLVDNVFDVNEMRIGFVTHTNYLAKVLIYPKSGAIRQVTSECSGWANRSNWDSIQSSFIWTNTSANITAINIVTGLITAGEYKLYRLK